MICLEWSNISRKRLILAKNWGKGDIYFHSFSVLIIRFLCVSILSLLCFFRERTRSLPQGEAELLDCNIGENNCREHWTEVNLWISKQRQTHSSCHLFRVCLQDQIGTNLNQISNIKYIVLRYRCIYPAASTPHSWAAVQRPRAANLLQVVVAKTPVQSR